MFLFFVGCAQTVAPLSVLGKWHIVKKGDTVESIASSYGASAELIAELNEIPAAGEIQGRDQIFVPLKSGTPPGDGKPPKVTPKKTNDTVAERSDSNNAITTHVVQGQCGQQGRPCFLWPVDGAFSRPFGKDENGDHDGIDIEAPEGTPVVAANDGEVLYSGDAIKGYGNLVLIRHEDNIITVYAHNARNVVSEGTAVKRGDKVAEVGRSGAAARDHLHFEVRVNEQPTDPLLYLPSVENQKE
ncbi:MAG: M23 family metallopeptidase [Deltaproteobacteria bacterium]|nr:M23 family metallopeptidase [Deltaproteobacteria bacterium]MBN2673456.1 M23 family metallopeptidase [Deltaproteobacteria bacterium]